MTSERRIPRPNLGQRLRMAREHAGLEQGELAARIGVSRNTVGNAERNVHALRPAALEAWSEVTNVDADWIREGVEETSEADDLVDEIARLVLSRARRDSNPQPSDLVSRTILGLAA